MDLDMFDRERQWLDRHLGRPSWGEGCRRLQQQLDGWLGEYTPPVCEQPVTDAHAGYPRYCGRLWECWGWHWRQAAEADGEQPVDGALVAAEIRLGRGYQGGGRLGGDPLRDVVLAVAMLEKENKAACCFETDYREFSRRQAGRIAREVADQIDDWWNELLDHLAGYTRQSGEPAGKLERFRGRSALQNWLRPVLWRFLVTRLRGRGQQMPLLGDEPDMRPARDAADPLEQREGCTQLNAAFTGAIASLTDEERLVLFLRHLDGLEFKQIGPILGKNAGTACRIHQRALVRLREAVVEAVGPEATDPGDLNEALPTDPRRAAEMLWQALEQARQDEGSLDSGPSDEEELS